MAFVPRKPETPMDFEWDNSHAPVDTNSPFLMASRASKRTHSVFDSPYKSLPPAPSRSPFFQPSRPAQSFQFNGSVKDTTPYPFRVPESHTLYLSGSPSSSRSDRSTSRSGLDREKVVRRKKRPSYGRREDESRGVIKRRLNRERKERRVSQESKSSRETPEAKQESFWNRWLSALSLTSPPPAPVAKEVPPDGSESEAFSGSGKLEEYSPHVLPHIGSRGP